MQDHQEEGELEKLERRDRQLWFLAITMLAVLTLGLVLVLVPVVFGGGSAAGAPPLGQKLFYGFCVLMILFNVHLVQRQQVIRQLRLDLIREVARSRGLRHQARVDLLSSLPGRDQFRDSLAMEFRRAVATEIPLSVINILVDPDRKLMEEVERTEMLGEAARALRTRLRTDDSLYRCDRELFCTLVPGLTLEQANTLEDRLVDSLSQIRKQQPQFSFNTSVINFPAHTRSATEMVSLSLRVAGEGS